MKNNVVSVAAAMLVASLWVIPAAAAERNEVPEAYKWDLTTLFVDVAAWEKGREVLRQDIPQLGRWQGRLGESAATLLAAMTEWEGAYRRLERVYVYASALSDEDTRVARHLQMQQQAQQLLTDLQAATAYLRPELIGIGQPTIERFVADEPRLGQYRMFFDDILRAAPHTLSQPEETLLARSGLLAQAGGAAYGVFTNADLPYPEITLSSGEKVRLDAAGYAKYRASPMKADRDAVFAAFWARYGEFTRTLATTLNAHVDAHVFNKDARKFSSSLEAALFEYNIPVAVYTRLIDDVHANLPTLHRYLRLRQKIMGLPSLGYEDLYAPIVEDVQLSFTPEQAREMTLEAFAPLGSEYVEVLRKGYASRWVDFMPNTGKRTGAYSTSVYDAQPFQLLNYNGSWEDVSTLAHESGHSMHSFLSAKNQPYATAGYSIFVAEVASTLNENLLFRHAVAHAADDRTRLFMLASYLDRMRLTLFRQTLFAEFELRMHEAVERGEPLTGESLSQLYLGLLRQYYGHELGVTRIADAYATEWAYIPHFYSNFYVYQYATSMIGGMSLVENIVGDQAVKSGRAAQGREAYLQLLKGGSSKYPIDLLKDAGVDMSTSRPFEAAIREMNRIMDEMERIHARHKR